MLLAQRAADAAHHARDHLLADLLFLRRRRTISHLLLELLHLGLLHTRQVHAIELGAVTIRNSSGSSVGKVDGDSTSLQHMVAAVLFFGRSVSVLKL